MSNVATQTMINKFEMLSDADKRKVVSLVDAMFVQQTKAKTIETKDLMDAVASIGDEYAEAFKVLAE